MARRGLLRLGVAMIAVALLSACGSRPAGEGGFVGGDGSLTVLAPTDRRPAPTVAGTTLTGSAWSSESVAGKVIVYNVWGSWCAPCRAEAPALVAASKRTAELAVFVGLNTRDLEKAAPRAFVRAFDVPYVNLYDPDGRLLLAFAGQLPASAIPSTLVVDREGRTAARIIGQATEATLVGLVTDIAQEP